MNDLVWVDGVEYCAKRGWLVRTLHRVRHGYATQRIPFKRADRLTILDLQAPVFRWKATDMRPMTFPTLRAAETLLAPSELLRRIVPDLPATDDHGILKIEGEPTIYIPALLLIQALWMGRHVLNRALVTPNGIDHLAVAEVSGPGTQVLIRRGLAAAHVTGRLARLLAWTLTRPDARASHASVLAHLRQGQLGLTMPEAALRCWVWGVELDGLGLLAYAFGAVDRHLPIRGREIKVTVTGQTRVFPAYQAPPRSPWSSRYGQ